ncbi:hypothetical protein B0T25DRAFT_587577 [Lasiosphaeria hispida]|uniref:Uncharacterized protein n=1 Tax=Lasiosphaeria hispida TaxID=260671 RepID=A0AAJ0MKF8_9PEZI|nr:hypothetical protein B0T25DRAFT_587577 [Lasiosphaeria hispida]
MSNPADSKSPGGDLSEVEKHPAHVENSADLDGNAKLTTYKAGAMEAENVELNIGVLEAVRLYPMASLQAFIISCIITIESYCVFLISVFVVIDQFKREYGVLNYEQKCLIVLNAFIFIFYFTNSLTIIFVTISTIIIGGVYYVYKSKLDLNTYRILITL